MQCRLAQWSTLCMARFTADGGPPGRFQPLTSADLPRLASASEEGMGSPEVKVALLQRKKWGLTR